MVVMMVVMMMMRSRRSYNSRRLPRRAGPFSVDPREQIETGDPGLVVTMMMMANRMLAEFSFLA